MRMIQWRILCSAALNLTALLPSVSFSALNRKKRDLRITRHRGKEIIMKLMGKEKV